MSYLYSMYILSVLSVGYVQHVKAHPAMTQCGIIPKREGRIINGFNADENQFPWIASIQRDGAHECGGTVISRRFVISAAHCFTSDSTSNSSIVLGMYNLKDDMGKNYTATYRIKKLIQHDGYKTSNKKKNDIALIELDDGIKWTDYIQPICLPNVDVREHKYSIAAGWGPDFRRNTAGGDEQNKILRFVNIGILKNDICNEIYKGKGSMIRLDSSQMCAGKVNTTETHDTSEGDSGGPLQISFGGRNILVGITSASIKESIYPKAPGIYTRVFAYMDWIKEHVNEVYCYPPLWSGKGY